MRFEIGDQIGDGAYGNVYRGRDTELGRDVAIKFIRTAAGDEAFAKEQAKALTRCQCENVVTVYDLVELQDPADNARKSALIMELVPGDTVLTLTATGKIELDDIRRIGLGTINGLIEIHKAGVVHRDLSLDNVMATSKSVKIIDILYHYTMAGADPRTNDRFHREDRNSLREFLTKLIWTVNPTQAEVFSKNLGPESTIEAIRDAFIAATDPKLMVDISKEVERFYKLFTESTFDDSEDYVAALSEEIPDVVVRPLLEAMIANGGAPRKRGRFVDRMWKRLDENDQCIIGAGLSKAINREVPDGSWPGYIRMLSALDKSGWESLTKFCRLRLERTLLDDMRKGHYDIYRPEAERGTLGTWTIGFYQFLEKPGDIVGIVAALLRGTWYSQNYIGENFLRALPRFVKTSDDRQQLIEGLAAAIKNDAVRVKKNLDRLPAQWLKDIDAEVEKTKSPPADEQPAPSSKKSEGGAWFKKRHTGKHVGSGRRNYPGTHAEGDRRSGQPRRPRHDSFCLRPA
jgi:hypothetical protein